MSAFRTRLLGVLGSVVSLSACSNDPDAAALERELREGLTGDDLCTLEGGTEFSYVEGLQPALPTDYLEWRSVGAEDAINGWDATKSAIVNDETLTDAERDLLLASAFEDVATLHESSGSCVYPACDRYVATSPWDGFTMPSGAVHQLFAHGEYGPLLITSPDDAAGLLYEIDTPQEAAWMAMANRFEIVCDGRTYAKDGNSYLLYTERYDSCGDTTYGYRLRVYPDGQVELVDSALLSGSGCAVGRLPSGRISTTCRSPQGSPSTGAYLADAARMEGASVVAFLELARDLEHHGAPAELIAWAKRAAREETHHAEICRDLARRYGADVAATVIEPSPTQSLFDIALDNAVEGLGREAFGALVAHHQLLTARDPAVRAAMRVIARDEASHAEFSIALHRWLQEKLDAEQRESVARARADAQHPFRMTLCPERPSAMHHALGLPTQAVASALFEQLFAEDFAA